MQQSKEGRQALASEGWSNFAHTQGLENAVTGYVSQPTHANLAGQIAAGLAESLFGELPDAVVGIISKHDVGWAEVDLIALEHAAGKRPDSFLRITPRCAIAAWRRSIAAAEKVSPLAAYLTRKHFYLLAPRDHDRAYQGFIEEQGNCLAVGTDQFVQWPIWRGS